MRLWHQILIPYLDAKRLLSQHRECCALRGKGWGKKHSVVDYVFKHDLAHLYQYHLIVMSEMAKRDYIVDPAWYSRVYRGKQLSSSTLLEIGSYVFIDESECPSSIENYIESPWSLIYREHDIAYLKECLLNLKSKNAQLKNNVSIEEILIKIDLSGDMHEFR